MENMENVVGEQADMELPPGFRFHPTDEELISHYLSPKVVDNDFAARAVGEVDLNKCEPWELPRLAKMGEKEWYFFCVRDRKYPTGLRTNRATEAGYWKATGKDKEIFRGKTLVGMKKTLVFYKGRAPKGENSNWVMHEYRLEGSTSLQNPPSNTNNEWVICRVFQKNAAGDKIPFPGLMTSKSSVNVINCSGNLPPLMESSPYNATCTKIGESHVPCFSNTMDASTTSAQTSHYNNIDQPSYDGFISNQSFGNNYFPKIGGGNSYLLSQISHFPGNYIMSEQKTLRAILDNHGTEMKQGFKTEAMNYNASQDTGLSSDVNPAISSAVFNYETSWKLFDVVNCPSTSGGPVDLENLWNY